MRLVITQDGVATEFVTSGGGGPYPWLTRLGNLVIEARAGHLDSTGTREAANMTFELNNVDRQAAALIGRCVRAVAIAYDDDDNELLSGLVQQVQFGNSMTGSIEA